MQYKDLAVNPVSVVLQLVGAKWKILVIKELLKKEMRFVELKKNLGCTAKVLTACLKEMEEDGLIFRKNYNEVPPRVDYTLTDVGYSLASVLDSMADWGEGYKQFLKLIEKQNRKSKKEKID